MENQTKLSPKIGHVHLTVSDLTKSVHFYKDLLGFEITQKWPGAVFLSSEGYHHHIGLNTWSEDRTKKPREGEIGLYHFAILYPSRRELAQVVQRLVNANYTIGGASDHGVSEAIYLKDPDGNGIEIYRDRKISEWPRNKDGNLKMTSNFLDIDKLIEEA